MPVRFAGQGVPEEVRVAFRVFAMTSAIESFQIFAAAGASAGPNEPKQSPTRMWFPFGKAYWELDSTRIRRDLGYREIIPLDEAIRRTMNGRGPILQAKSIRIHSITLPKMQLLRHNWIVAGSLPLKRKDQLASQEVVRAQDQSLFRLIPECNDFGSHYTSKPGGE